MEFALSTRWNAFRHTDGEAMIDEILQLGLDRVELGCDLRMDLVPGVLAAVRRNAVRVVSLHNFCPLPVGAPRPDPELFLPTSPDTRERENAVRHTRRTIEFAHEVGAQAVVLHAGRVKMSVSSNELLRMYAEGDAGTEAYERLKMRLQKQRMARAQRHLDWLRSALDQLVPVAQAAGVRLALENLPTWDGMPSEIEMEQLGAHYGGAVGYWHDVGHAYTREQMGFINQQRWLERLQPYLLGMHLHDAAPGGVDHLAPSHGHVDFASLERFAVGEVHRVLEVSSQVSAADLAAGLVYLRNVWSSSGSRPEEGGA